MWAGVCSPATGQHVGHQKDGNKTRVSGWGEGGEEHDGQILRPDRMRPPEAG